MSFDGKTIGRRSQEWERQLADIKMTRTLLGGTKAMRAAGQTYLPKKESESQADYEHRLKGAVLLNQTKRTLEYLAGQVFQKPVKYQEPKDGETVAYDQFFFESFKEDVDLQGTNLSMFTKKLFSEGVADGVAFCFTDYPRVNVERDGDVQYVVGDDGSRKPRTLEVDAQMGLRPYWVLIKAEQVLDVWLTAEGGRSVVKEFRYAEQFEKKQDDGTRIKVNRVRYYTPGAWELWEQASANGEYVRIDGGTTNLNVIPLDWFIPGERKSNLTATPALEDLASMNVAHWQAFADHQQLMAFVRRPPWIGKEIEPPSGSDAIPLSPGIVLHGGAGADLKSVGVDPNSVQKSLEDLKDKEDKMSLYGLQMVVSNTGTMTATQAGIAAAASDSTLKGWVQLLIDTVENALKKVAQWHGQQDGPAVDINSDFRVAYDAALLALLSSMVDKGQLSKATLLETIKLMGVFSDEFDRGKEIEAIADEAAESAKRESQQYVPSFGSVLGAGAE